MKITVNSGILAKKLQALVGVINSSNTLPILDNFLFDLSGNQLKITASDLDNTMSTSIEVQSTENGLIAVPAKMLIEMLKTFPDQPLDFETVNNTLEICSISGNYNIAFYPGNEFPKMPELENPSTLSMNAKTLGTAISKTLFATGNDELRPMMSGVFVQLTTSGITFAATDAHKLVEYARTDVAANINADFIVPKKPLQLLKNVLTATEDEVSIAYNSSNACFTIADSTITCRLVDAKYPNYKAVIPTNNPNKLIINRSQFINSLKCVSIFSQKETHQIKLKMGGMQLNISAEDRDYSNKADETLTCNYEGQDMEIGFNSRFLIEMLSNLSSDEVQMELSQPNRAGIIKPLSGTAEGEDVLMLVMPSMLK